MLKGRRNLISRAHDVSDTQIRRHGRRDEAQLLGCGLKIVVSAQIFAGYHAVALGVIFALRRQYRADAGAALLAHRRPHLKVELLRAAICEMHGHLFRFRTKLLGNLQTQHAIALAQAFNADLDRKSGFPLHARQLCNRLH